MWFVCYSYSEDEKQYLGGVKERSDGTFSAFLQNKHSPFQDVLGEGKKYRFETFDQALAWLEDFLRCNLGFCHVESINPQEGIF